MSIITIKPRKALPFFSRHPWVYAGAIASQTESPDVGTPVTVKAHDGSFIAHGLYNPASKMRVRLYSWDESQPLDDALWAERIDAAIDLREALFTGTPTEKACRLIFSEADGLSGLTVDRVDDWLVVQWTSAALSQRQDAILGHLQQRLQPRGIWLRTEKGISELEGLTLQDGLLRGEAPPRPLFVEENGLQFGVDLVEGQKTGFYFDQRENRTQFLKYAWGRTLDVCSYTGAFAIAAARLGRCSSVTAIDSSESALQMVARNADLNGVTVQTIRADAFDELERQQGDEKTYDTIILDPPKMARTRGGLTRALKGYVRLNKAALSLLSRNGILVTCSCSGHVTREDFEQIIAKAAIESGRTVQILEQRGQAPDHPVATNCLETNYLKCFICRVV